MQSRMILNTFFNRTIFDIATIKLDVAMWREWCEPKGCSMTSAVLPFIYKTRHSHMPAVFHRSRLPCMSLMNSFRAES